MCLLIYAQLQGLLGKPNTFLEGLLINQLVIGNMLYHLA